MVDDDWLSLPGDEAEKNPAQPVADAPLAVFARLPRLYHQIEPRALADEDAPKEVVTDVAPPAAEDRNKIIESVWLGLSPKQRLYLDELEKQKFNNKAALRALRLVDPESTPCESTISKWKRQTDFAFMLKVRKTAHAAELLDKNEQVLAAGHIRDAALEPKPILYQGVPTGHEENQPDVALRANEQLAKLGGHLKQDDGPVRGEGPALVIQVVQSGGNIIDITPKGVIIDLPAPGGT